MITMVIKHLRPSWDDTPISSSIDLTFQVVNHEIDARYNMSSKETTVPFATFLCGKFASQKKKASKPITSLKKRLGQYLEEQLGHYFFHYMPHDSIFAGYMYKCNKYIYIVIVIILYIP